MTASQAPDHRGDRPQAQAQVPVEAGTQAGSRAAGLQADPQGGTPADPSVGTQEERTVVCEQCGTRQDPHQAFCESCNAVLRWGPAAGGAATAAARTAASPAGAASTGRGTQAGRAEATPPSGLAAAEPWAGATAGEQEEDDTLEAPPLPAAGTAPDLGSDAGPDADAGSEADAVAAAERARALLVPVADPQVLPDRPPTVAPVLPGRPAPVRPEVRVPGEQDVVGGLACPWCGTANPAERHFCSRCAMSMTAGPADAARRPWWRRILDHRNQEQPWAGDRPRLRRTLGRILRWVAWAAVAALAVTGLVHVGDGIDAARDHFAKRVPVVPDSATASHAYAQHGPGLAFDKFSNTWWGPGITGTDQGEWIEAHFREPVNLLNVGITAGESTHADTLAKSAIPHRIDARVTTDDGKVTTRTLLLDQASGFQKRAFDFRDVTSVRFTVVTAYNTSSTRQVAVAEIEFFGPTQEGSS